MPKPALRPSSDDSLINRYQRIRRFTETLCHPLVTEDFVVQSMPDVSPTKWHIGHVTWFFETFVLKNQPDYQPAHSDYEYLFNSYYNSVGEQFPRPERGLLSRPTVDQVLSWRTQVDNAVTALINAGVDNKTAKLIELGLNHEQQHQELLLMDIKHVFSRNPLNPAYRKPALARAEPAAPLEWCGFDGGVVPIGHQGEEFAFDNESPHHSTLLEPYQLADRLISNGEYLAFVEDSGYRQPALWLADGWQHVNDNNWKAPLYWRRHRGDWFEFTLYGLQPLDLNRPVCHISYYEADAFAGWAGARLPTEAEWEHAAAGQATADNGHLLSAQSGVHPQGTAGGDGLRQLFGDCWEWTCSAYQPYPGFRAATGAVGEYNGKFMINQMVMRGGACVTPADHIRATYRNFFYPHMRWQFGGIRLAR